jgi:hypothetical protein
MINNASFSTIDKVLLAFISLYLIITSLISLRFISAIFSADVKIEFIIIIGLIVSIFIIGITLWINALILSKRLVVGKREIDINLMICLIQSFSFFLDGFCIKYTQGVEWAGAVHFHQIIEFILYPPILTFEAIFNFRSTNGILIAVNFPPLVLSFFLVYMRKKYFKKENEYP